MGLNWVKTRHLFEGSIAFTRSNPPISARSFDSITAHLAESTTAADLGGGNGSAAAVEGPGAELRAMAPPLQAWGSKT